MSSSQIKNFVQEVYQNDTQVKRVIKEIESLNTLDKKLFKIQLSQFALGFKIMIQIEQELLNHQSLVPLKKFHPILFDVLLDSKFPFTHPKVVCKTPILVPSFADGRNLTPDIINAQWAPSILISKIVLQIPQFLATMLQKQKDKLYLIHVGGFQVGDEYDLEQFLNFNNVHVFSAIEHIQNAKPINRYLIITESQLLSFTILNPKEHILQLEKQFYLYEMKLIKRLQEKDNTGILALQFIVQLQGKKQEEIVITVQIKESGKFIEAVQRNLKRIDVGQNTEKKVEIPEDEVTLKAYQSTDIQRIENDIAVLNSQLDDDMSLQNINSLTESYQKVIEFYSAIADERFMIYVQGLKELLQREDVQMILQSKSESIKDSTQKVQRNKQKSPQQYQQARNSAQQNRREQDQYQDEGEEEDEDDDEEEEGEGEDEEEQDEDEEQGQDQEDGFVDLEEESKYQDKNQEEDSIFNDYQYANQGKAQQDQIQQQQQLHQQQILHQQQLLQQQQAQQAQKKQQINPSQLSPEKKGISPPNELKKAVQGTVSSEVKKQQEKIASSEGEQSIISENNVQTNDTSNSDLSIKQNVEEKVETSLSEAPQNNQTEISTQENKSNDQEKVAQQENKQPEQNDSQVNSVVGDAQKYISHENKDQQKLIETSPQTKENNEDSQKLVEHEQPEVQSNNNDKSQSQQEHSAEQSIPQSNLATSPKSEINSDDHKENDENNEEALATEENDGEQNEESLHTEEDHSEEKKEKGTNKLSAPKKPATSKSDAAKGTKSTTGKKPPGRVSKSGTGKEGVKKS